MSDYLNLFPRLRGTRHRKTSDEDENYNCIAWAAAGDTENWWWPDPLEQYYWPLGLQRGSYETQAFIAAFRMSRYEVCASADLEDGLEKVALFVLDGVVAHAARQLADGQWTSKLGELEDIEHELPALEGRRYGRAVVVLSRRR